MEYYREVESSMLHAIGYDRPNKVLYAFFNSGVAYKYFNVGINMYANLSHMADLVEEGEEGASLGKFFRDNIKNVGYDYKRLKQSNTDEKAK